MKITCYCDANASMGYIYLKPTKYATATAGSDHELAKYIDPNQVCIPYVTDNNLAADLDRMKIPPNTFKQDCGTAYDTEYGNDMDPQGYIIGIELTLKHQRFIELVNQQAFKVIQTHWRDWQYHVVTFDHMENVFKPGHLLYKLTNDEDAFIIVELAAPEELGITYSNMDDKRPIAIFKALISARDDIYPLEYLLKPNFVLHIDETSPTR
ncbi:hypothetical protein [Paenibacillus mendelii]|uniref:Uncharacterized protein n=1 Tax=Paenibacillus mendelii TaxID=206163 RepID=A0ABV6JCH9_9BACL|nr:hypothetical protein [Paenibacillus mendelii]MCQ6561488.1 hypothetical protein [Paenibacillus mendelii]